MTLSSSLTEDKLHKLLSDSKWNEAQELIKASPDLCSQEGSYLNCVPLLIAITNKAPLSIVESLVEAYPEAVSKKSSFGHLPVRSAIQWNAPKEVIFYLLRCYPEGIKETDKAGRSCLHYACLHLHATNIVQKLLDGWPESAGLVDNEGFYPLTLACLSNAECETIEALINAYPQAISETHSDEGLLPLHLAVLHGSPSDTIRCIHNAYPEAIHVLTKSGYLPLHYACRKDTSLETFKTVFEMNPDAAKVQGKTRGYTPLHIAARNGSSVEILRLLVEAFPAALNIKSDDGETPVESAERKGVYHMNLAATLAPFAGNSHRLVNTLNQTPIFTEPESKLKSLEERLAILEVDHKRLLSLGKTIQDSLIEHSTHLQRLKSEIKDNFFEKKASETSANQSKKALYHKSPRSHINAGF